MTERPVIDVSALPPTAFGARAPVWWGNTLLMLIETTTVALTVASYFYVWQNSQQWPPPRVDQYPPLLDPAPDLPAGTANALLLAASCLPMLWVDRAARRRDAVAVKAGLALVVLVGVVAIVLRFFEFPALKFHWDDNAYSSVVWAMLVLHLFYLALAAGEALVVLVWVALFGLDDKHAVDVTLTAGYWYWTAATWVLLYAVVYWAPRVL